MIGVKSVKILEVLDVLLLASTIASEEMRASSIAPQQLSLLGAFLYLSFQYF
jgi:hypothetical protein